MEQAHNEKEALRERIMAQRRETISKLESERSTKVITLIHRKEPWEEDEDSITIEDSEFVLMEIRRTPKRTRSCSKGFLYSAPWTRRSTA